MNDERKTEETPDARSFEGRVFARFDALDGRLDGMDGRLQALEAKQYDTKPIWERALTEIAETRAEVRETQEGMRTEMRAEFEKVRAEMQSNFRRIERHISILSGDVVKVRAAMDELALRIDELDESRA